MEYDAFPNHQAEISAEISIQPTEEDWKEYKSLLIKYVGVGGRDKMNPYEFARMAELDRLLYPE